VQRLIQFFCLGFLISGCLDVGSGRLEGSRSLSNTPYGYQVVDTIARAGLLSQRFEVRAGDCGRERDGSWSDCDNDRERSEISLWDLWEYGDNKWIGYSVFLPSDYRTSPRVKTTVGQIHQRGGPSGTAGGLPSNPPVMQAEMLGEEYFMRVHIPSGPADNVRNGSRDIDLARIDNMRGRWTDIAVNFDTSGGKELLAIYVNGQKRGEIRDWINFRPKDYLFKYGIYRSFVSGHNGPMPTQILYIDEVRLGSSMAEVMVDLERPID